MWNSKSKKGLSIFKFGKKECNFSSRLNQLWNGDEMPYSIKSCFAFVYYHNIDTVHIFRKNGNKVAHEVLYSYMQKDKEIAPPFYISSVYDVCSALKCYVKDIPGGLLIEEFENDWHKLAQCRNESKVKDKLTSIILKLPLANKNMLFHILFLASKVTEHRQKNEMSSKSLSIVLLPAMYEKVIDIVKVRDLYKFYDLLEFMIDNAIFVMGQEAYIEIENSLKKIGEKLEIKDQVLNEPDKQEEEKRVQFVSQDSGLNSTTLSLSSVSRTNTNYDQSILSEQNTSSMEDLLDTSDLGPSDHDEGSDHKRVYRSSTIVHSPTVVLVNMSSRKQERSTSNSSVEDVVESVCERQCTGTSHTCAGRKPHSIKECRPYSYCGSQDIDNVVRQESKYEDDYMPVYGRDFQKMDSVCQKYKSNKSQIIPGQNIRKKKPVLKRSSCIIAPLKRLQVPENSGETAISSSVSLNSKYLSPSHTNLFTKNVSQAVLKTKNRMRKNSMLLRASLSVPVIVDSPHREGEDSPRVTRTVSLDQPDSLYTISLPRPPYTVLRQRSQDEEFV